MKEEKEKRECIEFLKFWIYVDDHIEALDMVHLCESQYAMHSL